MPSGSREVISAQQIRGKVVVKADDGTGAGGKVKRKGPAPVTVDRDVTDGPSDARGDVINWYAITGHANARIGGPRPARIATANSRSEATSSFRLRMNDKHLTPTLSIHFKATLDSGKATISAEATITPAAGGAPVARVSVTYTLQQDPTNANRTNVTGSRTVNIANPGGIGFTEKGGAAVLNRGAYEIDFSVTIDSEADTRAEVFVDKANLSFPIR